MARILIVDDIGDFIRDAVQHINGDGSIRHEYVAAIGPASAREKLLRDKFDLVVTDYKMPPGEDGIALANWIHQTIKPRIPVILRSSAAESTICEESTHGYSLARTSGAIAGYAKKGGDNGLRDLVNSLLSQFAEQAIEGQVAL